MSFVAALKYCFCAFLSLLTILLYPFLIIFFSALLVFRKSCEYFVLLCDPQVAQIIGSLDAIFACKIPSNERPSSVVCIYLPVVQVATLETVLERLKDKIHTKGEFPTLTQSIVKRCGFLFWRNVDKFSLTKHVMDFDKRAQRKPISRDELRSLCMNELLKVPFKPNRSPWECLVIEKFQDGENPDVKSAIVLRYHHCLMDGHSLMKLLKTLNLNKFSWNGLGGKVRHPNENAYTLPCKLLKSIELAFLGPFYLWRSFLFDKDEDRPQSETLDEKWLSFESSPISMQDLKNVKNETGVNLSSLIFFLAVQAVKKMARCEDFERLGKVHCIFPYPMTSEPGSGLSNNFVALKLPVHTDATQNVDYCLEEIDKEFEKLRTSPLPRLMTFITHLIGCLPTCCIPDYNDLAPCLLTVSNFPGPVAGNKQDIDFVGYPYREIGFAVTPPKHLGYFVGCVSMNGQIRLHVAVKVKFTAGIDNKTTGKDMSRFIQSALDALSENWKQKN